MSTACNTESALPPYPICLFCGVYIGNPSNKGNGWERPARMEERIAADFQRWALEYMKTRRRLFRLHLMVSSEEVENIHSLSDWGQHAGAIAHLCRAIIKEGDCDRYYLTGMNFIHAFSNPPYNVPTDISLARIGGRGGRATFYKRRFTSFYPASIERDQPEEYSDKPIGYLVHAHCWVACYRSLGSKLTRSNLAKVVAASRKHWRSGSFGRIDRMIYYEKYQSSLYLPDLQFVMKRAQWRSFKHSQITANSIFTRIPLDVAVVIADVVCPIKHTRYDLADTEIMLSLFQWKLPDFFWRLRLEEDIIYELTDLKMNGTPIDLQILRLEAMFLIADNSTSSDFQGSLKNRKEIMNEILDIKRIYLDYA